MTAHAPAPNAGPGESGPAAAFRLDGQVRVRLIDGMKKAPADAVGRGAPITVLIGPIEAPLALRPSDDVLSSPASDGSEASPRGSFRTSLRPDAGP